MSYQILKTESSRDYELLDSGENEKLERYGKFVLSRPDPQALWNKNLSEKEWQKADAIFTRDEKAGWKIKLGMPKEWQIELGELKFWIKPTAFKHVGIFPEQISNWDFMRDLIKKSNREINVLNLFGYTGGATLACLEAGVKVCHLDGSKVAINWAKENAEISGLKDKPIRWILDDARAFIKREIKRGKKYEAIIMDPPAFGRGPDGELWKIEEHFLNLLELCKSVLSDKPLFFIINGYASGYSALAYKNNLDEIMKNFSGEIEIGELTIEESKSKRLLPAGIFARWKAVN